MCSNKDGAAVPLTQIRMTEKAFRKRPQHWRKKWLLPGSALNFQSKGNRPGKQCNQRLLLASSPGQGTWHQLWAPDPALLFQHQGLIPAGGWPAAFNDSSGYLSLHSLSGTARVFRVLRQSAYYCSDAYDWLMGEETSFYSLASIALIIFSANSQTSGCTNCAKKNMRCVCKIDLLGSVMLLLTLNAGLTWWLLNWAASESNDHLCKLEFRMAKWSRSSDWDLTSQRDWLALSVPNHSKEWFFVLPL